MKATEEQVKNQEKVIDELILLSEIHSWNSNRKNFFENIIKKLESSKGIINGEKVYYLSVGLIALKEGREDLSIDEGLTKDLLLITTSLTIMFHLGKHPFEKRNAVI